MSRVLCGTCRSAAKLRFVRMAFIPPRCHPERSEGPMYFRQNERLAGVNTSRSLRDVGWWPIQAWFWLEWGSSTAGQSLPAARSRFRAVHSDSISTRPLVLGAPCLAFFARRGKVKPETKIAQNRTWQRRFYDFNVWTEKKRVKKVRHMQPESGQARTGQGTRPLGLGQLSLLSARRSRASAR
jgi:hypothetical protein